MKKEDIDAIMIHVSGSPFGKDVRAADIDRFHRQKGWKMIGYNYVIDLDGTIEVGRPLTMDGAHCNLPGFSGKSYNKHAISICLIGGLDADGKEADTRTDAQKISCANLIAQLEMEYNIIDVLGHRDASPDLDGDGIINKYEYVKSCPCFDVRSEFPIAVCTASRK